MVPSPRLNGPPHLVCARVDSIFAILDKVGCVVIGDFSNGPASSYVKRAPHDTIYGHKKMVCLEQKHLYWGPI